MWHCPKWNTSPRGNSRNMMDMSSDMMKKYNSLKWNFKLKIAHAKSEWEIFEMSIPGLENNSTPIEFLELNWQFDHATADFQWTNGPVLFCNYSSFISGSLTTSNKWTQLTTVVANCTVATFTVTWTQSYATFTNPNWIASDPSRNQDYCPSPTSSATP